MVSSFKHSTRETGLKINSDYIYVYEGRVQTLSISVALIGAWNCKCLKKRKGPQLSKHHSTEDLDLHV
jgi:hypothetical protein